MMDGGRGWLLFEGMAMTVAELEAEVLSMPEETRVFLIERLIESLHDQDARDSPTESSMRSKRIPSSFYLSHISVARIAAEKTG